jgi:methylglutaconyl-CoA hydratase
MVLTLDASPTGILTCTLNRPAVRNALNLDLITALTEAVAAVTPDHRAVVLKGEGAYFCAGADLEWMRQSLTASETALRQEAALLATLLHTLHTCPVPVIAVVQGGAFGGGLGLLATADWVLAADNARFCFSEVKLGLIPAVISPWVIQAIGQRACRDLMLTARVFDAAHAQRIGLVHEVVNQTALYDGQLDERIASTVAGNAPGAVRHAKSWLHTLANTSTPLQLSETVIEQAITAITICRQSAEGQARMQAFLDKAK